MPRERRYTEEEYEELEGRIEVAVKFTGAENKEEYIQKVLNEFSPNSPDTFPFDRTFKIFKKSEIVREFENIRNEAERVLLAEYLDIFDTMVSQGTPPQDALEIAKERQREALEKAAELGAGIPEEKEEKVLAKPLTERQKAIYATKLEKSIITEPEIPRKKYERFSKYLERVYEETGEFT